MINKRKKLTRYRGSHTHGGGSKKKRRGAGNRGGRGMAGSGKRADQKKPTILKLYGTSYFGKKGFKSRRDKKKIKTISIQTIEDKLYNWLKKGILKKEKDIININLKKMGYNKLLSKGKPKNKFNIEVEYASKGAIEKIEKSGGKINVIHTQHNKVSS